MNKPLNLLALAASFLMALGSTTLRFIEHYRAASIAVAAAGIALGWFCLRAAKAQNHFTSSPFVVSRFPVLFVVLGFLAYGLPEHFSSTISQWRGARMLAYVVADTIVGTAFFFVVWIHTRRSPNVSPNA